MLPRRLAALLLYAIACGFILGGCSTTGQTLKGDASLHLSTVQRQAVKSVFNTSKRIAVVVGINHFDDGKWNPLRYAVKDAHDLAAVLNDTRYGHFDQVIVLTGPEDTTRGGILASLRKLYRQNTSPEDTILFYISTHGTLARTVDGGLHQYLVARDTRFDRIPETAIDVAELKKDLSGLKSRKKVLVLASCHSGKGKSQLNGELLKELSSLKAPFFVKPLEDVSKATIVLAASAWGEAAREDASLQNDVYTHFLIEGIKKSDSNGDGAVTVTEAHDYAKQQTYYLTKGKQRPSIESVITGEDPILLAGQVERSGKPVLYDYSQDYRDMVVLVDGVKKGTLPLGVAVTPGKHTMALKSGDGLDSVYNETFTAREGERIPIPLLVNGYAQGTSLRLGYQGFLTPAVDQSVAKPMPMLGLAYSNHSFFSSHLGYRADFSYGQDTQKLKVGAVVSDADVSQSTFGLSVLYRDAVGGMALYGGPRVGGLAISRDPKSSLIPNETILTPTLGGVAGLHFRFKKQVSLAVEGAVNYAGIKIGGTDTNAFYYSLFGVLSVNF